MTARRSPAHDRSLIAAAAAGVALGVLSLLADGPIPPRAIVILGNIIAPWAISAFAVGRLSRTWQRGGLAGTLALLLGVVAYYVGHAVRFTITTADLPSFADLNAVPLIWLAVAVTVGPLLGAAGAASARPGPAPIIAAALPSAVLLAETAFLVLDRRPWLWDLAAEPHRVNDLVIMVGLAAIAFVIPARTVPDRRRRLRSYGLALASAAAGSAALVGLYRLLLRAG